MKHAPALAAASIAVAGAALVTVGLSIEQHEGSTPVTVSHVSKVRGPIPSPGGGNPPSNFTKVLDLGGSHPVQGVVTGR